MAFKTNLTALRIAMTSRRPFVTLSFWRNRKSMPSIMGAESLGVYRSRDCRLHRVTMAARRQNKANERPSTKILPKHRETDIPVLTICLVTHNSSNWIEEWFESLSRSGYPKEKLRLSIVDNASTDNTCETVEKCLEFHGFSEASTFQRISFNLGFGRGQDKAISEAFSELILVINPDAYLSPGVLTKAVDFALKDDEDICAWEFSQTPYEHPKYYDPVTLETSWNSHACVLLSRSAYEKVGGYDKSLFMYGEDVDLSYKLRLAGFRLRYLPWAFVEHNVSLESGIRSEQSINILAANLCLRKRYGRLSDRLIGKIMVFRAMLSTNAEAKRSAKNAWEQYKSLRPNFKPISRGFIYFPFNGFNYDRIRSSVTQQIGTPIEDHLLPTISVITRIHKRTDVLGEALQSVNNQTYSKVEQILVFDKCEPYMNEDAETVHGNFNTRAEAANAGAKIATGEYLLFLDYDDVLFADHLKGLYLTLRSNREAVCAYGLSWEAMTQNRAFGGDKYMDFQLGMEAEFNLNKLKQSNFFAIQSVLIRKSAFRKVGGFRDELDKLEDWDLWKRLGEVGSFLPYHKVSSIYYTPDHILARFQRSKDLVLSEVPQ